MTGAPWLVVLDERQHGVGATQDVAGVDVRPRVDDVDADPANHARDDRYAAVAAPLHGLSIARDGQPVRLATLTEKETLPVSKSVRQTRGRGTSRPGTRRSSVSGIDWSAQLKKIERQFDGIPTPPTESDLRAQRENERREQLRRRQREDVFGSASRVVLVLSLGLAMNAWPYARACGVGLLGYLAASAAIVAGGVWAMVGT